MIDAVESAFYARQTDTSDPGPLAPLLDVLPADLAGVAAAIAGLVVHPVYLARTGLAHPHAAAKDAEARGARDLLRRAADRDARPLTTPRSPERRVIGTCRHYALLAAATFRHHGRPARLRVGFATYFVRDFHEDHWVCEYHDGRAWRLLDAELGEEVIARHYAIDFAPWDVPRDRFRVAGDVWAAVRAGAVDAARCGVSFIPPIRGAWFVAGSVLRDLAALNGRELLPWDYWGLARDLRPGSAVAPSVAARLDEVAAAIAGAAPDWRAVQAIYEAGDDLRVPATVLSFPGGAPLEVAV